MKVLHLSNWYPSESEPITGIFIKDFVDNISTSVYQKLVHVQARYSDNIFRIRKSSLSPSESSLILNSKFCRGRLTDYLTLLLLFLTRLSLGRRWWDIVNVHIAIPIFRYPKLVKLLFGSNIIITEHWSAYHYDFYLPVQSSGKKRLQKIFHHGFPVITVSRALAEDIRKFSGCDTFQSFVIPNIIRPETFNFKSSSKSNNHTTTFLIVATWSRIKQPFLIFESFMRLYRDGHDVALRVVGEGEQLHAMKKFVHDNGLEGRITFLGRLSKPEIAHEMQRADCFLHASKYETFSIVCAEALYCGTPVIASNIPAITDFVDQSNGLFSENTIEDWHLTLSKFMTIKDGFDRECISKRAIERFHPDHVRDQVLDAYRWTIENNSSHIR